MKLRGGRFLASAITVLALFVFVRPVTAETINAVRLIVLDPDGNVIEGVPAYMADADGNSLEYSSSNSAGYINFYLGYEDGTNYTVQIRPSQAYDCDGCSLYQNVDVNFTASVAEAEQDEVLGLTQVLDTVTLEQATRYITVTVTDQDGNAVDGISISGWPSEGTGYAYGTTNSEGIYSFAVDEDSTANWSLGAYSFDGSYSSSYEYDITVETTGETSVSLQVLRPDATINVALTDQDGNTVTLGDNAYGSIYCYDINASSERYFYSTLTSGQSGAALGVVGGYTYTCNAWLEGYGSAQVEVTIAADEETDAIIELLNHNAEVTFRYVDGDGNVITGLDSMSAYASSLRDAAGNDYWGDYAYGFDEGSGEVTLNVADDITYQVSGWFTQSSGASSASKGVTLAADGTQYLQTYTMTEVVGDSTTPQTVEQTLQEADASIVVTVLTPEGDAETQAWVSAVEETDDHTSWGAYVGGSVDSDGQVNLPVSSGKTYRIYAYPYSVYTEGSDTLPPTSQLIAVAADETVTVTMQSLAADWTVGIEVDYAESETSVSDGASASSYAYCYAYNADLGVDTYTGLIDNAGQMNLISGSTWNIGCMGYQDDVFYRSDDITYSAGSTAVVDDTLNITLEEFGDYYPSQTYTFSATSSTTLTLPDGVSTLVVPANAIDTSGNVSITVETATDYSVNDNAYPVSAYEFTALNSSGEEVTEFTSNLTLNLAYDEAALTALGVDENDLLGANFDDTTNSWQAPVSTSVDIENNVIQIVLSHFSAYGLVGDRSAAASIDVPTKPRRLDVTKIKRTSAKLTWRVPRDGQVTKYKVHVRKYGSRKAKHLQKFKNVTTTFKRVTTLKTDTRYQFKVKACNVEGCSAFTKWKAFRTK